MHTRSTARSALAALTTVALAAVGIAVASAPAQAAPSPVIAPTAQTVTTDPLPTTQIDGVVYTQLVVGNTVYAGGDFTNARPAGAAPGVNTVPRTSLLAYNLTTGALISSFNPVLNGKVYSIAASPDNSRIYVAGSFTTVSGQARYRLAAFDTATGALISTFRAGTDYNIKAVVATASTVYIGGAFNSAGGNTRTRLAAFRASDGALVDWAPSADATVQALALTPDKSRVIVGGAFATVSTLSRKGLAAVDATTGAVLPWAAGNLIQNSGTQAAILSLNVDANAVYGTGYTFGPGGNLEGTFSAEPNTGTIRWIEDCHGDHYQSYSNGSIVYAVSHSHFCGNIGAFPQSTPWIFHPGTAFTAQATGTITRNYLSGYYNFQGQPSPSMVTWHPDMQVGTFTGQHQAAWAITGSGNYVVVGGEFPKVNGVAQQGLVRFTTKASAPNKQGPVIKGAALNPRLTTPGAGMIRVALDASWDRDDQDLTYRIIRNGNTASPVYQTTVTSLEWKRPLVAFTDRGLTPGTSYSYRVIVSDPSGNEVTSETVSAVATGGAAMDAYSQDVTGANPGTYWRLGEASGDAVNTSGVRNGVVGSGVTRAVSGVLPGDGALRLNGTDTSMVSSPDWGNAPTQFTAETWFRTTSTTGGRLLGFGDSSTGTQNNYDRLMYLDNSGRVFFGVYDSAVKSVNTTGGYRDGQWHHVVGSLSTAGLKLYVDGALVAQRADVTQGDVVPGYWRAGAGNLSGWPSRPSSDNLTGDIDEVAIYPQVLTAADVSRHYQTAKNGPLPNQAPTASFTTSVTNLSAAVDGTASADADGTVVSWSWSWGDGTPAGAGSTNSHVYAAAGTYPVVLTVTDDKGATSSTTRSVTVNAPPNVLPTASFTSSTSALTASFDGSASSDADGTIASYSWDFGDGSPAGSGATPSHRYAAGGTYQVTLTVTDDRGGNGSVTKSVTVTPAPNVAPTATFSASTVGLKASFDASASSDSDGTIASYAWDFGDGTTGSGATTTRTYAAAGTYPVVLTVTDNDGATSTVTKSVVVSTDLPLVAADAFGRTVTGGLGVADQGGTWTVSGGTANFAVSGGQGKFTMAAPGAGPAASLRSVSKTDVDAVVDVSLDKATTGSGIFAAYSARTSAGGEYRAKVKWSTGAATVLYVTRRDSAGAETVIVQKTITDLVPTTSTTLRMRFQVSGTGTTVLRAKAWDASLTEPTAWGIDTTDTTAALQVAGYFGIWTYLAGNATNAPLVASFDNLSVRGQ